MLRRSLVLVTASIAAFALALGAAAATQTVQIASHISIKGKQLKFSGKVTSSNAACKQDRHVTLYRKFSNGSSSAIGSTTTPASGKWQVTASGSAGISLSHFFARVKRRSDGTAGTIFVCKAAKSSTIAFQP